MDYNLNEELATETQPITPVNKSIGAYNVEMEASERILSGNYLHHIYIYGSTHQAQASYSTY